MSRSAAFLEFQLALCLAAIGAHWLGFGLVLGGLAGWWIARRGLVRALRTRSTAIPVRAQFIHQVAHLEAIRVFSHPIVRATFLAICPCGKCLERDPAAW